MSEASGMDDVSAALLGNSRVGTGFGSDFSTVSINLFIGPGGSEMGRNHAGGPVVGSAFTALWERHWETEAAEGSGASLLKHLRHSPKCTPKILSSWTSPFVLQPRCSSNALDLLQRKDRKERLLEGTT